MRKETVEYEVYKFEELSDEVKEEVLEHFRYFNVEDIDWWEYTYEDAKNVGIEITGFDLDRGRDITGKFIYSAKDTAESIIKEHGKDCNTYKLAKKYLDDIIPIEMMEKFTEELDEDKLEEISEEFLKDILHEYFKILKNEFEYLTSDECIKESIECNDYEFLKNGKIY
jgi:hypothetical protein